MLGLQNEREWLAFCDKVLLTPALASDPRFDTNARRSGARAELRALIVETFAGMTIAEVEQRLEAAGIANAQVNDMAQVWAHPQLQARGRWVNVATPAGPVPALLPPGADSPHSVRMDAVPALGQHTRALLAELGYGEAEVAELQRSGAV